MDYLIYYVLFISLIGLYVMFSDKQRAKKKEFRISEKTIWIVSILGGAIGTSLGMKWFRHKTKHPSFKWGLPILALLELGGVFALYLS